MKLQATKTPLLIAAIATAVTVAGLGPASAKAYWASADADAAQVIDANFKLKVKKHKLHHGYKFHAPKYHGVHKKKHVAPKHSIKKKKLLKKLF